MALSLPCVTGPFASVNCSVTLSESYVRRGADGYGGNPADDTTNFAAYVSAVGSMITSSAQSDTGLFDTNLRDERYLPFEGAGVISKWTLELMGKPRPFDYDTIADVILTIRYTARPGGNRALAEKTAEQWLKSNAARVFSMRHEFASQWAVFKQQTAAGGNKPTLAFSLTQDHFPYRIEKITEKPKRVHLFMSGSATGDVELFRNGTSLGTTQLVSGTTLAPSGLAATGHFELRCDSNELDDLWVVIDWAKETA